MTYIDGFVIPVPHDKKDAYRAMVEKVAPLFQEHGVLRMVETWGVDLPKGKVTDFHKAVQAEDGENVAFSWMVWPSKDVRDAGWDALMKDERMKPDGEMPFDGKRMFWGGFAPIFDSAGEFTA